MKFRPLDLACVCGRAPAGLKAVGLTSEYELVVHWTCEACNQTVYSIKSLTDCCREVPETEDFAELAAVNGRPASEAEDADFLHTLGVRFPED